MARFKTSRNKSKRSNKRNNVDVRKQQKVGLTRFSTAEVVDVVLNDQHPDYNPELKVIVGSVKARRLKEEFNSDISTLNYYNPYFGAGIYIPPLIGETVQLSYVDQSRDNLSGENTIWDEIANSLDVIKLGDVEVNSRAYCSSFNFKGGDQQKKVKLLSGGERNRVHMANLLKEGGNVLLLDEPTNDLDVETLRALEEALLEFAGCAMIISHDRFFLDRLCTHILSFEGNSQVDWFEGNFADFEADKLRRLGVASLEPKRIKYKKFSR